jgi:hypothetical protein
MTKGSKASFSGSMKDFKVDKVFFVMDLDPELHKWNDLIVQRCQDVVRWDDFIGIARSGFWLWDGHLKRWWNSTLLLSCKFVLKIPAHPLRIDGGIRITQRPSLALFRMWENLVICFLAYPFSYRTCSDPVIYASRPDPTRPELLSHTTGSVSMSCPS